MEGDVGRDLNGNGKGKDEAAVPSCCLKARAFPVDPELEANCHATVVSGWFSGEAHSLEVKKILFKEKSEYQEVVVFESATYGKVVVLDGILQLTEKDESAYQEMIAHLPLCSVKSPKNVLVVGGGDGGVVREIARHSSVELIDICEIDKMVIDVSRKFFPELAVGFEDPRVHLHVADMLLNLSETHHKESMMRLLLIHLILWVQLKNLWKGHSLLRPGGVLCNMAESITHLIQDMVTACREIFKGEVHYAWASVPTYPSGVIGFILCSTDPPVDFKIPVNPIEKIEEALQHWRELRFYNSQMHRAAFALPSFVKREVSCL